MSKPGYLNYPLNDERRARIAHVCAKLGTRITDRGAMLAAIDYVLRSHPETRDAWPVKRKDGNNDRI